MKPRTITAMVLAYVLPGAGHLYLGKRGRAIAFFCIVVLMFALGLAVDGDLYTIGQSGGSLLRLLAANVDRVDGADHHGEENQGDHHLDQREACLAFLAFE